MKSFIPFICLCMLSTIGRSQVTNHLRTPDKYSVNVSNEYVNITINLGNDTDNKFIGGTFQGPNADPPIQSGGGRPLWYDPSQIGNRN